MVPWTEKYRPRNPAQLVGNGTARKELEDWLRQWVSSPPRKRAILLVGPPGVGKTASVHAIANALDAELVEFNASDQRNREVVDTLIRRSATQGTLDGRMRIILLDEVDGLSGAGDRGGLRSILKLVDETAYPIVMTANSADDDRMKDVVRKCKLLSFSPVSHSDIIEVLKRICRAERIELSEESLSSIAERASGDLRAAISDLEAIASGTLGSVSSAPAPRDTLWPITEMLPRLFSSVDPSVARRILSNTDVDYEQVLLWVEENCPLHLQASSELDVGYEAFSLADLVLGRITRGQTWKLLSYFYDLLGTGLTQSRTKTPFRKSRYSRPSLPLLVWKGNKIGEKRVALLSKIARISGISRYRIQHVYWHTLQFLSQASDSMAKEIRNWLGLKEDLFSLLLKRK